MIERTVYGPMEYLAPDTKLDASLELSGVKVPPSPCTVHVFLDEVAGDDLDALVRTANYAGCFTIPADVSEQGTVRIDITYALKKAEAVRPNFHITFLAECSAGETGGRQLQFESMHILHDTPHAVKLDISADVLGGLVPDRKDAADDSV